MKRKQEDPIPLTSCPRCGAVTQAAVWPYLKGTLEYGYKLSWRRCQACRTLFSELTEITCGPDEGRLHIHGDAGERYRNGEPEGTQPDQRRHHGGVTDGPDLAR